MKISILSFVPFPLPDESPISAIQRTARANGFKNCHGLLSYLSKTTSLLTYGNCLLDNSAVSRALQVCSPEHADRIKANFYHTAHPLLMRASVLVGGVEISYSNFRRKDTALCTECLMEEHEKFPKDIKLFSNCPFHNRAFLFRCPTCNVRIKWKTQLTCHCECGERLVSPKVSDSEMAQDHYLLRLFQQGDTEKIASIQRILAVLEHETHSTDDAVRSARCALAIAISRRDVESMINEIHNCLPCSSADEIDVILTIFDTELGPSITTTLRQRLISTTAEQKTRVAKVTLSVAKLQEYIGMSQATWYNLKYRHAYFRGIGRGAKISLKNAIKLRKTLTSDKEFDHNPDQESLKNSQKQLFSISAVQHLTDMPEETIKTLALKTNILGLKKHYIKQTEKGSELLFGRNLIDLFNQRYVCSHRMAREWNIPIQTINNIIRAHHFELKKFKFIHETIIIKKICHCEFPRSSKALYPSLLSVKNGLTFLAKHYRTLLSI
ncbi:TniQ family protein [Pseudomonas umsongensis]|uniref:TniQ family protein n=1 Tax=Pseudomonas umsongensis TaxID=198618 RepID=UPI00200B7215|nr:TniQ family protein [Pseudomonas umsongensis]MCK8683256.1 TniQ family protein [Pseudomonas umsongensis]